MGVSSQGDGEGSSQGSRDGKGAGEGSQCAILNATCTARELRTCWHKSRFAAGAAQGHAAHILDASALGIQRHKL